MKKIMVAALLTSAITIALIVASMVYITGVSDKNKDKEAVELDLLDDRFGKDEINKGASKQLTLGKEIKYNPKKQATQIYNVEYSNQIMKKLDALKRKREYTIEKPLLAYNPFGTNELSLYVYFRTEETTSLKYTIQVDDDLVPDFTRKLNAHHDGDTTTIHEYQLTGFYPGCENYVTLFLYNRKGKLIQKSLFHFYVEKTREPLQKNISVSDGESKLKPSYGLYFVCGQKLDGKNLSKSITMYDNSGIIRGAIPIVKDACVRVEEYQGNILYNISKQDFVVVSPIGQVLKKFHLDGYQLHKDFIYNDYEQIWILADSKKKGARTTGDMIVSLNMKNGETSVMADMKKLLGSYKKKEKKKGNWIDLNSIQRIGSSDIIVSSGKLSTIFKLLSVTSERPSMGYIIAEPGIWKKTPYKKYVLKKGYFQNGSWSDEPVKGEVKATGDFTSQYGQNSLSYYESPKLKNGQYYLTLWNNSKRPKQSFYYKYMVDEEEGYYGLGNSEKLSYFSNCGSVWNKQDTFIVGAGDRNYFEECDRYGEIVRSYQMKENGSFQRIYKLGMNEFWFREGNGQEA